MFDRKLKNDSHLLSWPGLLVLAVTTWGILSTAPRLVSQRPRGGSEHTQADAFDESVPARLWQDPLSVAHQALQKAPDSTESRRGFAKLFKSQLGKHLHRGHQSVLCLTVMMPSNRYADGAEECRRRRYAVLSALGVARYAPKNSTGIGYALLPMASWHGASTHTTHDTRLTHNQHNGGEADLDASNAEAVHGNDDSSPNRDHIVVPFEWFEPEAPPVTQGDNSNSSAVHQHSLIFVHYLDESRIEDTPLSTLARLVKQMRKSIDDFAGPSDAGLEKRNQGPTATFAVLGPVSSTTLRGMWQEYEHDETLQDNLLNVTCYSTQATATMYRQQATFASRTPSGSADKQHGFRVHHLIGKDVELARELVYELHLRGISAAKDQIALVTEWDTHYGRNMLQTFTAAFGPANRQNVQAITYLRGLDGLLPTESSGAVPEEEDESGPATDLAVGPQQIDYVRRFVEQMKHKAATSKDHRIKAIGILGSDVYDKLMLLRALRREFPGAVLFTTDLDDRLLHRREYKWTHNLLIASHYDLRLQDLLQHTVPPFRNSYQTSLYLGCLKAIVNGVATPATESTESESVLRFVRQLDTKQFDSFASNTIDDQQIRPSREMNQSDRVARPCVLVYEVGRSGRYGMTCVPAGHWIHPPGSRHYTMDQWTRQLKLLLAACLAFLLVIPLAPPIQDFVTATLRAKLDWRHDVVVISVLVIALMWLLIRLDHIRQTGEPFALYEGISVWPTICIRILLIAFCVACVIRSHVRLKGSIDRILSRHVASGGDDPVLPSQEQLSLGLALPAVVIMQLVRRWLHHARSFWRWVQQLASHGNFVQRIRWNRETILGWGKRIELEILGAQSQSLGTARIWQEYGHQGSFTRRHQRLIPHLLVLVAAVLTLFWTFGFAISPARGDLCRHFNRIIFIVSSIALIWLIFFVLDAIRLCDRLVWILDKDLTQWGTDAMGAEAKRRSMGASLSETNVSEQLVDRLFDVKTVAAHTDLVSRLIYAPSVGLLIWFVARHSVFDNWGWTPPIIGAFLTAAAITMYAAVFLGHSSRQFKESATQAVASLVETLPTDDPVHDQAEAVLREISTTTSAAMEPLRRNPVVSAVLVPFGSLSGLGLLEIVVDMFS